MKFISAIVFVLASTVMSATLPSATAVKDHADNVVRNLKDRRIEKAFALVKEHWPLDSIEIDELERTTITNFAVVDERLGKIIDMELITDVSVGSSLRRLTYIIRHERHIIRVRLTYLRNSSGWVVNGVKWDDDVDGLFKEQ